MVRLKKQQQRAPARSRAPPSGALHNSRKPGVGQVSVPANASMTYGIISGIPKDFGFGSPIQKNTKNGAAFKGWFPIRWSNIQSPTTNTLFIPLTLSKWFMERNPAAGAAGAKLQSKIANLGGVPSRLLTIANLYNEFRLKGKVGIVFMPAGGTGQAGRIVMSLLRDPADAFRGDLTTTMTTTAYVPLNGSDGVQLSAEEVLEMEQPKIGLVSLPWHAYFDIDSSTWIRQDSQMVAADAEWVSTDRWSVQPTGMLRQDAPHGGICVNSDVDITGGVNSSKVGFFMIYLDMEFRSSVVPRLQQSQTAAP